MLGVAEGDGEGDGDGDEVGDRVGEGDEVAIVNVPSLGARTLGFAQAVRRISAASRVRAIKFQGLMP
jgi:hypothetical protein